MQLAGSAAFRPSASPFPAQFLRPRPPHATLHNTLQAVQVQLKKGEKSEKDDESPVTVADYGAQALVAWSLRRSFPGQPISLVAEEDAVELRAPEGEGMLGRITALVNDALAVEHPQVCEAGGGRGRELLLAAALAVHSLNGGAVRSTQHVACFPCPAGGAAHARASGRPD